MTRPEYVLCVAAVVWHSGCSGCPKKAVRDGYCADHQPRGK